MLSSLAQPLQCAAPKAEAPSTGQPLSQPSTTARSGPACTQAACTPQAQATPETPPSAPSRRRLCSALSLASTPHALGTGDTGPPCWDAPLAAGSPSTYPARPLTGRRSTCFPTTSSPVGDGQDSVTGEGKAARRRDGGPPGLGGGGVSAARSDRTPASGRRQNSDLHISHLRVVHRDLWSQSKTVTGGWPSPVPAGAWSWLLTPASVPSDHRKASF